MLPALLLVAFLSADPPPVDPPAIGTPEVETSKAQAQKVETPEVKAPVVKRKYDSAKAIVAEFQKGIRLTPAQKGQYFFEGDLDAANVQEAWTREAIETKFDEPEHRILKLNNGRSALVPGTYEFWEWRRDDGMAIIQFRKHGPESSELRIVNATFKPMDRVVGFRNLTPRNWSLDGKDTKAILASYRPNDMALALKKPDGKFVKEFANYLSASDLLYLATELKNADEKEEARTCLAWATKAAKEEKQAAAQSAAEETARWHNWTHVTDGSKFDGRLTWVISSKVKLVKKDGSIEIIPVGELSENDQTWIKAGKWKPVKIANVMTPADATLAKINELKASLQPSEPPSASLPPQIPKAQPKQTLGEIATPKATPGDVMKGPFAKVKVLSGGTFVPFQAEAQITNEDRFLHWSNIPQAFSDFWFLRNQEQQGTTKFQAESAGNSRNARVWSTTRRTWR